MSTNEELTFKDVPQDAWGMTIVVVVRDLASILKCQASWVSVVRTLFVLCAVILNLTLQLTVLWNVKVYIVGQAIHETQQDYAKYHAEVFDADGGFRDKAWKVWTGPAMELCNLAVSKSNFTMAIIFLWTGRMLGELRDIERLHRNIHSIKNVDHSKEMVEPLSRDGQVWWVGLTHPARCSLYILVVIPKIVIAIILGRIGCAWLAATESFAELILNALALEFVIDVDELIYRHFAPQVMHEYLKQFKMVTVAKKSGDPNSAEFAAYARSFGYMFICAAWAYVFIHHIQQVIPGFAHDIDIHCGDWFTSKYEPICPADPFRLRMNSEKCFPFGGGTSHGSGPSPAHAHGGVGK